MTNQAHSNSITSEECLLENLRFCISKLLNISNKKYINKSQLTDYLSELSISIGELSELQDFLHDHTTFYKLYSAMKEMYNFDSQINTAIITLRFQPGEPKYCQIDIDVTTGYSVGYQLIKKGTNNVID